MKGASQGDRERIVLIFRWCQLAAVPFSLTCLSLFSCPVTFAPLAVTQGLALPGRALGRCPIWKKTKSFEECVALFCLALSQPYISEDTSYGHTLISRSEGGDLRLVQNRVSGDSTAGWAVGGRK